MNLSGLFMRTIFRLTFLVDFLSGSKDHGESVADLQQTIGLLSTEIVRQIRKKVCGELIRALSADIFLFFHKQKVHCSGAYSWRICSGFWRLQQTLANSAASPLESAGDVHLADPQPTRVVTTVDTCDDVLNYPQTIVYNLWKILYPRYNFYVATMLSIALPCTCSK